MKIQLQDVDGNSSLLGYCQWNGCGISEPDLVTFTIPL